MKKSVVLIMICLLNSILLFSQVAINNDGSAPDESSALDVYYTNKGFLLPRMTKSQILAISNPANGLLVFCTGDNNFYTYIENENAWKLISFGSEAISSSCNSITMNHTAGAIAPVTKTVTYQTVYTNLSGDYKCWITSNLGADHQATAVNDATEASAGWYWQFNRMQGYKHDGTTRTPGNPWITSIDENSEWLSANDPCTHLLGSNWRIPTYMEWNNVYNDGGWINWKGPWNSGMKIHMAGYLYIVDGSLVNRGITGRFWSITEYNNLYAYWLQINSSSCVDTYNNKATGLTLRCLRD